MAEGTLAYLHDRIERSPVEGLALKGGHFARHLDLLLPLGDDELEVGMCDREGTRGLGIDKGWRGTKNCGPAMQ